MLLRRATTGDFEACKKLHDTDRADVLYYDFERAEEEPNPSDTLAENYFFSEEDLKIILAECEFTLERFTRYFDDDYGRIYMFEDDDENIIAYVKLFKIQGFRWKLAELQIEEECQTMEVFTQILNDLMKEKKIREVDVCTPIPSALEKLKAVGYRQTSGSTMYLRRSKRSG